MGWTPLFLEMQDKKVLIVGSGEVGKRRTRRFLEAKASVVVIGTHVPDDILDMGAIIKPEEELEKWVEWADIVVTASSNHELNQQAGDFAKNKLVNRADYPDKGNLIVPSSFFIGDVQICISTGGKSPLMSRELRKKIEKVISPEDVLQLELQDFARKILKKKVDDQKKRKTYLYTILNDEKVQKLLKEGRVEEAELIVENLIQKS
jgi:precorrin-2 dehydrogenase/sirohydrochlorin ferrochelatase